MLEDHKILVIDDDQDILLAAKLLLKRHFAAVDICNRPEQLPKLMAAGQYDAILLDMNFSPGESSSKEGLYWLQQVLEMDPDAVVVMITAHSAVELAVETMKYGATDFIAKPWQNEKVLATLSAAIKLRHSRREASMLRQSNEALIEVNQPHSEMIGESTHMQQVKRVIERAAPTDANVLILGENGTGKELVARDLHQQSHRRDKAFVAVDLGAVSENLFESELFGHAKGAFTGADKARVGRLLAANGGTLFLDEIGNIPLHLQAKLLTVLEQRQVTPLGSNKSQALDIRLVAATNVDREQLSDERLFRQDLLYRLNTVEIKLPALRERAGDIALIAQHYLHMHKRKYHKAELEFSATALREISRYEWPGNVRALRHAVERAVILSDGPFVESTDMQIPTSATFSETNPETDFMLGAASSNDHQDLDLEKAERELVSTALHRHNFNISQAAKALGITRASLYRRMEKYDL
ncbi:sigma-54-dependent transcriptional regulator [Pseudoteredinibacter isoporae]|uniref:DNA-binding NtrC family response regulator n=1 Tax=Pseudoteredinibacter isoporae TaxID=570281 RepID=A0A7X0MWZ2_9GAMM|nr:sigma-54 dependent transcriptional regulator [Pseudoteredinibacter isoporae]MBB6521509.1 DNA-binding NtrC family response regulator [Pseudoteredinibacter isoporae]NHO87063.1 sigma-54-dependent Fis family transcriptional regulator [Pseudoteredinibacter isoporae]NIB22810.1 sigma-54-dependent Fis family transcriptional regulator [Pseudoteredinibacter isoporae]